MKWFSRKAGKHENPEPDERAVSELLDRYHPRASMSDGDRILIEPSKVLENIATAMERVDLDINTTISVEEDVASTDEIMSVIQNMQMGPTLAVHVINTAMAIMSSRYPEELVRRPLPRSYDLRQIVPLEIRDQQHEIAKTIFNRRTTSAADLTEGDIAAELEGLDVAAQMELFVTLFYMYGTKIGAMKHRTGID